jgi:Restriction endonuclease S subunits
MGLTKLGSLIQIREERNDADFNLPFYGININKEFMPSVANTDGVDRKKYKIVRKNKFVFSGMQTGRDVCIRIGLYTDDEPVLVSPAYTTFEVTSPLIIPTYLFMIFCSKEKDRLGWFLSDSSVRSNLDWDRFCGIQIDLPSIEIQKKYVDIYNSLIDNLKIFEKGSDDLSLICDGTIEKWRKESSSPIGSRLIESHEINSQSEKLPELGVSISKTLINTKAVSSDQTNQKIVRPGRFVYVTVTSRNGGACSIALDRDILCSVSSSYCTFDVTKDLYP